MDTAVALVQAYLNINGYFTVAEYPLVEVSRGHVRARTDLDILAFRFVPHAPEEKRRVHEAIVGDTSEVVDTALDAPVDRSDMIIGEVKEGAARFNRAMRDPDVIEAVLTRFGCCRPADSRAVAEQLIAHGRVTTPCGHVARLVEFGTSYDGPTTREHLVPLEHVADFVFRHIANHRDAFRASQTKHPAMAWLAMLEKFGLSVADRPQRP